METACDGDYLASQANSDLGQGNRRISTRSIKRKKFDDELVESSLIKSDRVRPKMQGSSESKLATPVTACSSIVVASSSGERVDVLPVTQPFVDRKKIHKSAKSSKRPKKAKAFSSQANFLTDIHNDHSNISIARKDLGRWKAQDDLSLITAVQQACDLTAVYLGVKFSCKFTLNEIKERWYALLYDPTLSKLAVQSIKQLHPDVIASVHAKALFSVGEEKLLSTVASTSQPTLEVFEKLLAENPTTFFPLRTAKSLLIHWQLMRQYHLLPDQTVQPMPKGDHVLNFSDAEDMLNDKDLTEPQDEILEQELSIADRRQKKEIRHLEQELPKWQVLVDSVTGISPPEFDNLTLAVIRGRLVRYLMRSKEITLGRATKDNQIDVDLSLEGPAWKISRRQGLIRMKKNGDFYIANEGKRPIYVDGKAVLTGNKESLRNNSVIEMTCLRFIFLINQDLIAGFKQDVNKAVTS